MIKKTVIIILLTISAASHLVAQKNRKLDILIKNAYVFDGTGGDSVRLDIGVSGDRIVFLGIAEAGMTAAREIDATDLYLAPGFIDPHTHHAGRLSSEDAHSRALLRCLMQGVTTIFAGNDGAGPLPIGETLRQWEEDGIGVNVGLFAPHGSVRAAVIGYRNIGASPDQIDQMREIVRTSMEEGAFGLSTGLFYTPGFFSTTTEVIELAKVAAAYGGIYDTHQRDEGSQNIGVVKSVKEVLEIGEKAGIPVHISHIKVSGTQSWGKSEEIVRLVEKAQRRGLKASANQYPYLASRTSLEAALIPTWVRDGGRSAMKQRFEDAGLRDSIKAGVAEAINARTGTAAKLFLSIPSDTSLNGKHLEEVAKSWNTSPQEAVIRILTEKTPAVHSFIMSEKDMLTFVRQPWVMIGSDGGGGHPRSFGTFPRAIRNYALDKKIVSIAEMIRKCSGLTAETVNIKKRGLIKKGYYADLVIFDPNTIRDHATFENAAQKPSGIPYVIVNGKIAIDDGEYTQALAGRALRLNESRQ